MELASDKIELVYLFQEIFDIANQEVWYNPAR